MEERKEGGRREEREGEDGRTEEGREGGGGWVSEENKLFPRGGGTYL